MKFINCNSPIKLRIGDSHNCYWKTIRTGETIDLTMETGKQLGFTELKPKLTEGQIGNKKVETKQIEKSVDSFDAQQDFFKELKKIKGIGKKTAEDIIKIFPVREELIKKIRSSTDKNALPFRDDISKILMEKFS